MGYVDDVIEPATSRQRIISALTCWNPRENRCLPRSTEISRYSQLGGAEVQELD